jgi:hypothetical protein
MYRMSYESFDKFCGFIKPFMPKDKIVSRRRTGKGKIVSRRRTGKGGFTTEICLHCLLRWLAGGSYLDNRISVGISMASFYKIVHRTIDANL